MNNSIRRAGLCIKMRRHELKLSQEELALRSRLDRTYLSGIENGKKNLSLAVFLRLSEALETDPWTLLQDALEKKS
ncbi:MAG: helix-turn-helix transcriptional regulator [Rhodospirillales bacterium]|nr:helix-turn-helix transcriptional regulator [Rhodospirillales bacterium]